MTNRWRAYAAAVVLSAGLGLLSVAPASAALTEPVSLLAASASEFATPSSTAALASSPLLVAPAPTANPAGEQTAEVKKNLFALQSMDSPAALILLLALVLLFGAIIAVVRAGSTHRAR